MINTELASVLAEVVPGIVWTQQGERCLSGNVGALSILITQEAITWHVQVSDISLGRYARSWDAGKALEAHLQEQLLSLELAVYGRTAADRAFDVYPVPILHQVDGVWEWTTSEDSSRDLPEHGYSSAIEAMAGFAKHRVTQFRILKGVIEQAGSALKSAKQICSKNTDAISLDT